MIGAFQERKPLFFSFPEMMKFFHFFLSTEFENVSKKVKH